VARRAKDRAGDRAGRQTDSPQAAPPAVAEPAVSTETWGTSRRARLAMMAAALLAGLWGLALGGMALFTANPVTLNREQVLRSDAVIRGDVVDLEEGQVQVERLWPVRRPVEGESLRLANLKATKASNGEAYLMPVSRTADGYEVTRTSLPGEVPLIYPATNEAEAQLERVLEGR
jgi:hypothetical protein